MDGLSTADKLAKFAEAYGVAVRAGCITPNIEDEKAVRKMFGLPEPSADVISQWAKSDGVRLPITLQQTLVENTKTPEATPPTPPE